MVAAPRGMIFGPIRVGFDRETIKKLKNFDRGRLTDDDLVQITEAVDRLQRGYREVLLPALDVPDLYYFQVTATVWLLLSVGRLRRDGSRNGEFRGVL